MLLLAAASCYILLPAGPAACRRATRRLDELMQQLERAATVVGDTDLAAKFAAGRETIRRDIMFAASLYI